MLELIDIHYAHRGGKELFGGASLAVGPGERVAVTAPSGAGKTTLCSIAAGYLQPCAGKILVDSAPLPKRGVCPVQMIWQHPERVLDPRMRMGDSLVEAGAVDASLLQSLGIRDEWLGRYPHELSGGELQRFCIARALAANPRYLIADEISTMLDAVTQAQLWRFLLAQARERDLGMIIVSHSPALLGRVATRTVSLQELTAPAS